MSPSMSPLASMVTSAAHRGPVVRCVSVLVARSMVADTRLVVMRNAPGRAVTDHVSSCGVWLNCQ